MAIAPADGDAASAAGAVGNPWLRRRGIAKAFCRTLVEITLRPARFARSVPWQATQRDSLLFLVTGLAVALVTIVFLQLCWMALLGAALSAFGAPPPLLAMFSTGRMLRLLAAAIPVGIAIAAVGALVESAIAHVILRNAARPLPLSHTRQIYFYFFGAAAALTPVFVLPCVGGLLAMAWVGYGVYVTLAMLRASHGTSTGRTLAAVLVGRVMNGVAGVALALSILFSAPQLLGLPPTILRGAFRPSGTPGLAGAIAEHRVRTGAWPATPLQVVLSDSSLGFELLSLVGDDAMRIGGVDFAVLWDGDTGAIQAESAAMQGRIPAGAAFRIGRGHFLYPLSDGDSADWLMVLFVPAPPGAPGQESYAIMTATGTKLIAASTLQQEVAAENKRLVERGRPALPELSTLVDVSGVASNPNAVPAAPEKPREEEESASDELGAESDPDPR